MKGLESRNCSFCGHMACLRCCHKKKNFQPKPGQTVAVQGLACRICDRKLMHKSIISTDIEQIEYRYKFDINDEEHVLFGTRKDITGAEEDLEKAAAKEGPQMQILVEKEKKIKKDQVELKKSIQELEQQGKPME